MVIDITFFLGFVCGLWTFAIVGIYQDMRFTKKFKRIVEKIDEKIDNKK